MRYINLRFTYLPTYLDKAYMACSVYVFRSLEMS